MKVPGFIVCSQGINYVAVDYGGIPVKHIRKLAALAWWIGQTQSAAIITVADEYLPRVYFIIYVETKVAGARNTAVKLSVAEVGCWLTFTADVASVSQALV